MKPIDVRRKLLALQARSKMHLRRAWMYRAISGDSSLAARLDQIWSTLPQPLGCAGYTLPDIRGGVVRRYSDGNVLVRPAGVNWREEPHFRFGAGARDNLVVIGAGSNAPSSLWFQGSGCTAIFGDGIMWPLNIDVRFSSDRGLLYVGAKTSSNGTSIILEGDGTKVIIGDDCMFARGTTVRTSDLHGLMNTASREWLNPPGDILLEPHVWVGEDAMLLRTTFLGFGTVVGAKSLVKGDFPRTSVVAGVPARVVRTNVMWVRDRAPSEEKVRLHLEFGTALPLFPKLQQEGNPTVARPLRG